MFPLLCHQIIINLIKLGIYNINYRVIHWETVIRKLWMGANEVILDSPYLMGL